MARIPRWAGSAETARLILGRLDGSLDVSDIATLTGTAEEDVEKILAPLLASGMLAVTDAGEPGVAAPSLSPPPLLPHERKGSGEIPIADTGTLSPSAISEDDRRRVTELYARLDKIDMYRLLGVAATADQKEIKRAYFALAKLHHPDRFFRKDVGALRPKIDAVFAAMTRALDTLTDPKQRPLYDAYLREVLKTRITRRTAEALENRGDWEGAADVWARVVEALPRDAFVLYRWANALLRARKELQVALDAVTQAIELDPQRAEYRLTAASLNLAMRRERSALAELEVACELESDRSDIAGLAAAIAERVKASGSGET